MKNRRIKDLIKLCFYCFLYLKHNFDDRKPYQYFNFNYNVYLRN